MIEKSLTDSTRKVCGARVNGKFKMCCKVNMEVTIDVTTYMIGEYVKDFMKLRVVDRIIGGGFTVLN